MTTTATSKERPILFSAPMVRALLALLKTQTRRALRPEWAALIDEVSGKSSNPDGREDEVTIGYLSGGPGGPAWYVWLTEYFDEGVFLLGQCPYGQPGDRLWVRETWGVGQHLNGLPPSAVFCIEGGNSVYFKADGPPPEHVDTWRPSIHMPRAAARLLLKVVSVRVERVQDISEQDAVAEGVNVVERYAGHYLTGAGAGDPHYENYLDENRFEFTAADSYRTLWASINGPDSWAANPWVWVVTFKVVEEGGRAS